MELNTYTLKQYKEAYNALVEDHISNYEDYSEETFIEAELENFTNGFIDLGDILHSHEIEDILHDKGCFGPEPYGELVKNRNIFIDAVKKSNLSSVLILEFLEEKKLKLIPVPEQKNTTPASNIDEVQEFFNHMNNNRVNEIKMINFIEFITESKIDKLKVFYKDIESFEVEFITNKVVDNLLTSKVNNQDLSETFEVLKTLVLDKIQEIENVIEGDVKPKKDKTLEAWFNVGLLFADGTMDKYYNENKKDFKGNYDAAKVAREIKDKRGEKIILATIKNYSYDNSNSHKNIFNSLEKMQCILTYCNDNNIEVCQYFMDRYYKKLEEIK
jgi:hypothetical protein